jgi:hypothetical protein
MTDELKELLNEVSEKKISIEDAYHQIKKLSLVNVDDIVQFDVFRDARTGIPEVVYSEYKTPEHCVEIIQKVVPKKKVVLFTRLKNDHKIALTNFLASNQEFLYEMPKLGNSAIIYDSNYTFPKISGTKVGLITAGTSDIPIAVEAESVLKIMGIETVSAYDIGVAGLHRLINPLKKMLEDNIDVLIVLAGMEGALPSVIAGLVNIPVIAVPISVGYGIRPPGEVALLSMLSSCSPGMSVVNVDAGFNAGAMAGLIALRCSMKK